jgi:alkylation response protein AidB-like acyl-CoA dehydrogenase
MSERAIWTRGGGWLLERPDTVFTPEDFDDVTTDIAETTRTFVDREVGPVLAAMEAGALEHNVPLMRTAGELGLLAAEVPEAYGGLDLPKTVSAVIAEEMARTGGFAVTHGAHSSIGTLPLVYFGTDDQKDRYLEKLASGQWIAAYALTEPGSGSDALGAKTTATLSADGAYYELTGTKMWITNAGFADLFTVFAKVDGDRFTAFLIERESPGLSFGEEEHKMGIRSSSTRILNLDGVQVPVANVLGEVGRGHKIAFNVLNVGRYKLGAAAVGGSKRVLHLAATYAKERHQFGTPIASFGLMQHKLAEMAVRTFAAESALYRTMGLIDMALHGRSGAEAVLAGIEEYAVESSIIKVLGSEVLDFCVDEGVQIHGGLGFSAEYEIERAYRDSRINRIFEGTNEINRLLIPGMLLKRAMKGEIPLVQAATRLQTELLEPNFDEPDDLELAAVVDLKRLVLLIAGAAVQTFGTRLEQEQEVLAAVADGAIDAFAAESALLRARRLGTDVHLAMARIALAGAKARAGQAAITALPRLADGDDARLLLSAARRLTKADPVDIIGLRRQVAEAVLAADGYPVSRAVPAQA